MLLNELFDHNSVADAAFAFGRFNPPHKGHVEVWNTVANSGKQWYVCTNPSTQGPKDPLPYDVKIAWMTAIDPKVKDHVLPEKTILTAAVEIFKRLGGRADKTIAYITDDQDWAWSGKLLNEYNGREAAHGYYEFAEITHVPSPRISSATALRDAARAGDQAAFYDAAGVEPNLIIDGQSYFDTVVKYLEQHSEKTKKSKKVTDSIVGGSPEALKRGVGNASYVSQKTKEFESTMRINDIISENHNVSSAKLEFHTVDLKLNQIVEHLQKRMIVYENFITNDNYFSFRLYSGIRRYTKETTEQNEIKPFIDRINQLNYKGNISVGDQFSVLNFDINFSSKEIDVFGFKEPKKVSDIVLAKDGKINYIKFTDGDRYPRITPATYSGKPVVYAAYFTSSNDASKALSMINLSVPTGWELYLNNLSETMLPKSAFAGSNKNKLGPAGQLKGNMKRPARAGDLVGGGAESIQTPKKSKTVKESDWHQGRSVQGIANDIISFIGDNPSDSAILDAVNGEAKASGLNTAQTQQLFDLVHDAVRPNVQEDRQEINFTVDDIKELERIKNIDELKQAALALISKPSKRPMSTEKVNWFKNHLKGMKDRTAIIKLMYDLLLSGEGNAVIGTRHSTKKNVFRQIFPGESVEETKQRLDPKCWKGYRKQGTKIKGDKRVNNCVKVSEDWEQQMSSLIKILESK